MSMKRDQQLGAPSMAKGPPKLRVTPSSFLQPVGPSPSPSAPASKDGTPAESVEESITSTAVNLTKPEMFTNFLQGNGVRMAFVRTLVALYEEEKKPDDPLPYICTLMGKGLPKEEEILSKQDELTILRAQYQYKQDENHSLRFRLAKYITPPEEDGEGIDDFGFQFEYDPNNYNYLNKQSTEEETAQDGDDEDTPATAATN